MKRLLGSMSRLGALALVWMGLAHPALGGGRDLEDVIPSLYGGDGVNLAEVTGAGFEHSPHFLANSLRELNALNGEISNALGLVSLSSTVAGFTFDLELGVPVRTEGSMGPILGERARTLGHRRLNVGINFSRTSFKLFEGAKLNRLELIFPHEDSNLDGVLGPNPAIGFLRDFERDFIRVDLDLEIQQQVYAFLATYGVTDTLDVGIAIPVVDMNVKANAVGEVVKVGTNPAAAIHVFDPAVESPFTSAKGTKTGLGDILLRTKWNPYRGDDTRLPDAALLGQVTIPSGDQANFLGRDQWRLLGMVILSKTVHERLSFHTNLGWEWVEGDSRQNNARYVVGGDVMLHPRATFVVDVIGRWEHEGDGVGDHLVDGAVGLKLKLWRNLLATTNWILPINRTSGLRADFIPTVGFEYLFGGPS